MIKVLGQIKNIVFVSVIILLLCLTSCKKEEPIDMEVNNEQFFKDIQHFYDDAKVQITDLVIYYKNDFYYYDVIYYSDAENENYNMLHIYRYGLGEEFFSIKYPEQCYAHCPEEYNRYLDAKESGISKVFTKEEIDECIRIYYIEPGVKYYD